MGHSGSRESRGSKGAGPDVSDYVFARCEFWLIFAWIGGVVSLQIATTSCSTPVPQTESSEPKPGASRSSHVEELPIDEHRDKMLEQVGSRVLLEGDRPRKENTCH